MSWDNDMITGKWAEELQNLKETVAAGVDRLSKHVLHSNKDLGRLYVRLLFHERLLKRKGKKRANLVLELLEGDFVKLLGVIKSDDLKEKMKEGRYVLGQLIWQQIEKLVSHDGFELVDRLSEMQNKIELLKDEWDSFFTNYNVKVDWENKLIEINKKAAPPSRKTTSKRDSKVKKTTVKPRASKKLVPKPIKSKK